MGGYVPFAVVGPTANDRYSRKRSFVWFYTRSVLAAVLPILATIGPSPLERP